MPFALKETRFIPELDSKACLYEHEATGARLLSLQNSDENKAFGITFRTPPTRSDGVAHILEHSVLCGSRRYPVKEPFVELMKGSLNTFLNAFTYPDKTVYPLASTNTKDFYNLIDVYLDAVFHPLISEDTFMQEGWHYEMDPGTGELSYKGVVYNEMKGAYSDPDDIHDDLCRRSLFPDTAYGLDSGGDPAVIPSLDYSSFKRFHETYYHPSNAFIYFYGDDDPEERLAIMERWLSPYARLDIDSMPGIQEPFSSPVELVSTYEGSDPKAWTAVNWVLPLDGSSETKLALSILSHILIGTPSSPLRVALIDSGLGEDLAGFGLEAELRQQAFSVGLKGVDPSNAVKVRDIVLSVLADLAGKGIDPDAVAASMNTVEFALREKNTGRFPRGLAIMLEALGDWLYDKNPLDALAFESSLSSIKAKLASPGYFEYLIHQFLLENTHRSIVTLLPDPEAGNLRAAAERDALTKAASSLKPHELAAIRETAERLRIKQEKPDSPEALATIPSLGLADLPRDASPLPCEVHGYGNSTILFHNLPTSSILYFDMAFPLDAVDEGLIPYVGLLGRVLLEMGAGNLDYIALNRKIGKETGGIGASTLAVSSWNRIEPVSRFIIRAKTLAPKTDSLLDLLRIILLSPNLDAKERFKQIVLEEKAQAESSLVPSGHRILALRLKSRLTRADSISDRIGGVEQLFFLRELAHRIESDWAGVLDDLSRLCSSILVAAGSVFNITIDAASYANISPKIRAFIDGLPVGSTIQAGSATASG
ncbi:MAG TPA: insulinase family protein, partial [Rectinemataceae bacterium]